MQFQNDFWKWISINWFIRVLKIIFKYNKKKIASAYSLNYVKQTRLYLTLNAPTAGHLTGIKEKFLDSSKKILLKPFRGNVLSFTKWWNDWLQNFKTYLFKPVAFWLSYVGKAATPAQDGIFSHEHGLWSKHESKEYPAWWN